MARSESPVDVVLQQLLAIQLERFPRLLMFQVGSSVADRWLRHAMDIDVLVLQHAGNEALAEADLQEASESLMKLLVSNNELSRRLPHRLLCDCVFGPASFEKNPPSIPFIGLHLAPVPHIMLNVLSTQYPFAVAEFLAVNSSLCDARLSDLLPEPNLDEATLAESDLRLLTTLRQNPSAGRAVKSVERMLRNRRNARLQSVPLPPAALAALPRG